MALRHDAYSKAGHAHSKQRNNDMPAKHGRGQLDLTTKTDKSHAPKRKGNMQQKIYIRTSDIVES